MPIYDVHGNLIGSGGNDDVIQPYFTNELATTVTSVRAVQTEPCLTFAVVTDIHYNSVDKIVFPHTIQNIKAFSKQVRLDGILCLGDMTDGTQTREVTAGLLNEIMPTQRNIGIPVFFAAGNHDCNAYGAAANVYTTAQMYQHYYSHCTNNVMIDSESYGVNYYKDYDAYKIRMISLDSSKSDDGSSGHYRYPMNTVTWFVDTALATVPTGYTVLLITHLSPIASHNWKNTVPNNASDVVTALNSFVNKGGDVICFFGHSHSDYALSTPWLDIAFHCNKAERSDDLIRVNSDWPDGAKQWGRKIGTVTEDCWDIAVIKPLSRHIDTIRFGAGEDRTFIY